MHCFDLFLLLLPDVLYDFRETAERKGPTTHVHMEVLDEIGYTGTSVDAQTHAQDASSTLCKNARVPLK